MKKSDITPEMFQTWKADMRIIFKDDPNNMNLIAIGLSVIDDKNKSDLHENWNKQLLGFYENELARSGELVCEFCGKPMDIYYTVVCNHCQAGKPKIENNEGNYLRAVRWLKNNEPDFDEDYLWSYLVNHDIVKGNDSYMVLLDNCQTDFRYNKYIEIFKKHFPIENIKWFVSW